MIWILVCHLNVKTDIYSTDISWFVPACYTALCHFQWSG